MKRFQIVKSLRKKHPSGTRVVLEDMFGHPEMKPGLQGTVKTVDDRGQIQVEWDDGNDVPLIPGHDRYSIISKKSRK